MDKFNWEKSFTYLTGKLYREWGELLMDPNTSLEQMADFVFKNDMDAEIRFLAKEEEDDS